MKQVSDKSTRYQIRGMLLPLNPATKFPIFLSVNGTLILPIFTTSEKFEAASKWGKFAHAKPNVIVDAQNFQDHVLYFKKKLNFHVAIDPYITEDGNTRFELVPWENEDERKS